MIAIPAVDLRDGACVQLEGGIPELERLRLPEPIRAVRHWAEAGFARLHVVDLDAAWGSGSNAALVEEILSVTTAATQVGGGIRTTAAVDWLLERGAASVVVGTRAVEDLEWLEAVAHRYPGQVVVAVDARERQVVVRGWADTLPVDVLGAVRTIARLPLGGLLVTAVHREGRMRGPDTDLVRDVVRACALPVYAAGGVASIEDLDRLANCGAAGAIVGMALYTGALDASTVANQFRTLP